MALETIFFLLEESSFAYLFQEAMLARFPKPAASLRKEKKYNPPKNYMKGFSPSQPVLSSVLMRGRKSKMPVYRWVYLSFWLG